MLRVNKMFEIANTPLPLAYSDVMRRHRFSIYSTRFNIQSPLFLCLAPSSTFMAGNPAPNHRTIADIVYLNLIQHD